MSLTTATVTTPHQRATSIALSALSSSRWSRGAAALILLIAASQLIDDPFYLTQLTFISINALLMLGLALLFGYAGQISVGQAGFYGVGAYAAGLMSVETGLPAALGFVAAVALPSAAAYLLGRPILKLKHFYLAMATLALGDMLVVLFQEWKSVTGGYTGVIGIAPVSLFGFEFDIPKRFLLLSGSFAIVAFVLASNFVNTRHGRALRALRESEKAASSMGVDIVKYKVAMFTVAAGLAGLSGALYAHFIGYVSPPTFSGRLSIVLLLMLFIGGVRSLWGALIGACFSVLLPEWLARFEGIDVIVYSLAVVLVMIFLPGGIAGGVNGLRSRLQSARRRKTTGTVQR